MASLHMITQPTDVQACLPFLAAEDGLMLCGDAVYALRQPLTHSGHVYALAEDVQARNLDSGSQAVTVNYPEFVALCMAYTKVVTW